MKLRKLFPKLLLVLVAFCVLLFLLSPIIAVVGGSFNDGGYFAFPPKSVSLRQYRAALTNKEHLESLAASLKVATYSTVVASLLCVPACVALAKTSNPIVNKVKTLFMAPIFLPGIVWAVGLLQCMGFLRIQGSLAILICVHTVIVTPYMIRIVGASMDNFNYTLEDAAASLGAPPLTTFFRITLPNIMSGIVVGMVFSFMISFSDVVITLFVSSSSFTTFPVRVYAAMRTEGLDPMVLAYSAIIIVVVLSISILGEKFAHWSKHFSTML
ncbi:MAG: Inner membrane ABC transporter permease protein YdcV [Firmicutes bacterium ADurb.Bin182]|nr:MAG: Inner membrane ABC transporter permease protein YdcV [Firmicutes bacterium ADurb.Bin182]